MTFTNILKRLSQGLLAIILISPMLLSTAHAECVEFQCPVLKTELQKMLGKDEIEIADLEAIEGKLDLSYLNIKSLGGLEHLKNVEHLVLSFNNITDITPVLGLKNLKSLYVDNNWITELPSWSDLVSLEHLDISRNDIAKVPKGFISTPALRRLYMTDLKLDEGLDLKALSCSLDRLDVSGNQIEDLSFLDGQNLELLNMNRCALDSLPNLFLMDRLSYLSIAQNNISELPEYFGNLPLVRLDFSYNNVTSLPQSFSRLSMLEQLVFTGNYFRVLPDVVTKLKSLEVLMCGQNIITDVPNNLAQLENIKRASFAGNELDTLYKFQGLRIPYSYQISVDENYLDLEEEINVEMLKRYHNDGGVQKTARLEAKVVKNYTDSLVIDLKLDNGGINSNTEVVDVKIFSVTGATLSEKMCEVTKRDDGIEISSTDQEIGNYDYLVCMVLEKSDDPKKLIKYTAELDGVAIVEAPVITPTVEPIVPVVEAPIEAVQEEKDKSNSNKNYLLYILLFGVIMIVIAYILQNKRKPKRRKHKR